MGSTEKGKDLRIGAGNGLVGISIEGKEKKERGKTSRAEVIQNRKRCRIPNGTRISLRRRVNCQGKAAEWI